MPDQEIPERLEITKPTLKALFAVSGNVCAFRGCTHPLVLSDGTLVSETCHIEAAMPLGERFNAASTNDERRHANNLILLCHAHHKVTNDVAEWTVEKLRDLKAKHEEKFERALGAMQTSEIRDLTELTAATRPSTLARFGRGEHTPEQMSATLSEYVTPIIQNFEKLSLETRDVLLLVAERGELKGDITNRDLAVPLKELVQITRVDAQEIREHVATAARYRLADRYSDPFDNDEWVRFIPHDGYGFWADLRNFAREVEIPLVVFMRNMRFDLLD